MQILGKDKKKLSAKIIGRQRGYQDNTTSALFSDTPLQRQTEIHSIITRDAFFLVYKVAKNIN